MASVSKHFLSEKSPSLDMPVVESLIRQALIEDIGKGDITTTLTIPKDKEIKAAIIAKEDFIVCGLPVAEKAFQVVDPDTKFISSTKDGKQVKKGRIIAKISGNARSILSAERVALNLLSMLSGVATLTRAYVEHIEPYKTKITDTRKTIPGMRQLQKYAVRVGDGFNHRMGLDEMILIKDNHLKVTDGFERLPSVPKGYKIEIEVQNMEEFIHALKFKPDVIMLDNMNIPDIREAVKIRNNTEFKSHHSPTKLEASGGVDFDSVREIAATGVDIISIGALTHSPKAADISLEVQ